MNPSFLRAHLAIALGITGATPKPTEPDPEDPPRRLNEHGMPIFVIAGDDPRLPDLIHRMDAARLPREVVHLTDAQVTDLCRRHDASNSPVDVLPALPPRADMARLFEDPPVWHAHGEPRSKRPPPCAGHSRLGRPVRVGGEARRPGTADSEKRAKRKAAEKSRRRNRR